MVRSKKTFGDVYISRCILDILYETRPSKWLINVKIYKYKICHVGGIFFVQDYIKKATCIYIIHEMCLGFYVE